MSWRTVLVTKRCKLDTKLNYMELRYNDFFEKIFLDEIAIVILGHPAISITGCLLEQFIKRNIRVIMCDSKRLPIAEVVPYHSRHDSPLVLKRQITWTDNAKGKVWQRIIAEKITNQASVLYDYDINDTADLLMSYIPQIQPYDKTNKEGPAAKAYFNALFGNGFTRGAENGINAALDYGYSILLSAVCREISKLGYNTELGIFHENRFNFYNLASDIMEPLRPMVDCLVYELEPKTLERSHKLSLINILSWIVESDGVSRPMLDALNKYVRSVMMAIEKDDPSLISFFEGYELQIYENDFDV